MGINVRERAAQILLDRAELDGQFVASTGNLVQFCLDPRGGEFAVGGQVDEVLLLDGELAKLSFELLLEELLCPGFVCHRRFEVLPHGGNELAAELDASIVRLDGALDAFQVRVWGLADMVLRSPTEEVGVFTTIASGGPHDDHALDDVIFQAAASTPDRAFEVVVVLNTAFPGLVAGVEQRLDLLE